jgi:hypothetical protein
MKSGMDVMPLENTPSSYSYFPTFGNINATDAQTFDVGGLSFSIRHIITHDPSSVNGHKNYPFCHLPLAI